MTRVKFSIPAYPELMNTQLRDIAHNCECNPLLRAKIRTIGDYFDAGDEGISKIHGMGKVKCITAKDTVLSYCMNWLHDNKPRAWKEFLDNIETV